MFVKVGCDVWDKALQAWLVLLSGIKSWGLGANGTGCQGLSNERELYFQSEVFLLFSLLCNAHPYPYFCHGFQNYHLSKNIGEIKERTRITCELSKLVVHSWCGPSAVKSQLTCIYQHVQGFLLWPQSKINGKSTNLVRLKRLLCI